MLRLETFMPDNRVAIVVGDLDADLISAPVLAVLAPSQYSRRSTASSSKVVLRLWHQRHAPLRSIDGVVRSDVNGRVGEDRVHGWLTAVRATQARKHAL